MRIKDVLKEKGLTQKELADLMGISPQGVKQMVGSQSVTTATLSKVATALGVPMWQLIASPAEVRADLDAEAADPDTFVCPRCGAALRVALHE